MAAYKSRVLHETWKGRLRPRNHYALGWLPRWGRLITTFPGLGSLVNLVGGAPLLGRALKFGAGVDGRRQIPRFANRAARRQLALVADTARRELDARPGVTRTGSVTPAARTNNIASPSPSATAKGEVLIWVDSFSDCFESRSFGAMI